MKSGAIFQLCLFSFNLGAGLARYLDGYSGLTHLIVATFCLAMVGLHYKLDKV